MKIKLLIITLVFGLFSCEIQNNQSKDDFSKYYSDQCPEGEIMSSWLLHTDGTIKVNKCVKPFSCPEGKEIISQCSSMIGDVPCKLYCVRKNEFFDW